MNVSCTMEGVAMTVLTLTVATTVLAMMGTFRKKINRVVLVCTAGLIIRQYADNIHLFLY